MKKLFTISIALLLISCTKKEGIKTEKSNEISSEETILSDLENDKHTLLSLLNKFEDKSQFFTISNSKNKDVKGKKGTIIHIIPNNLELENGGVITGNLKVELKELTNQKDLFKNNTQTVSNGKLLISGGSYYIDITSNGTKVNLKKGKTLEVEFPKITNRNMELFYGKRDSLNQMNWETTNTKFSNQIPKEKTVVDAQPDKEDGISNDFDDLLAYTEGGEENIPIKDIKTVSKTQSKIYESINLSKLGWINCDAFYSKPTENISFAFDQKDTLSFIKTFIIFENMNSVMSIVTHNDKNSSKLNNTMMNLPIGEKIKIISFSYQDEKYYSNAKKLIVAKNTPITLSLNKTSEKEIEKLFKI
jgi:hypothetical protein